MARPDADDTLTQIHRLPNEIIGAAELKPVFRFGRRLQVDVSTLSGVQDDGIHSDAGNNKDDTVSTGVQDDGIHADAGKNKDDTVSTAKAEAEAKAKAYEKTVAKLKAQLADMRKVRAESEGWRRIVEETRRAVYFFKE